MLGYSSTPGANFIALGKVASACGKVFVGYIADRYERLNMLLLCTFLSAISTLTLWLPSTVARDKSTGMDLLAVYVVFYSATAGAYVSFSPQS